MIWYNQNQSYTGHWENGIQNGIGEWIWYQKRGVASQYPMNNAYHGQISEGLRHGYGIFYYANGARYQGQWKSNVKCGQGKFIFKNGRVYEGTFQDDHIVEYPEFEMDGRVTPDLSMIRTRTPLPSERAASAAHTNVSVNTFSPSFQLDIDHLLLKFEETDREEESTQVMHTMMRHMTSLHRIYSFYSHLGLETSKVNAFLMNHMQFWRFLKDCKFHHLNCGLMQMDRLIAPDLGYFQDSHNPDRKVLFREFLNNLVVLASHLYHSEESGNSGRFLATCLSRLITENVLKNACTVNGYIYGKLERANNVLVHQDSVHGVYNALCTARKGLPPDDTLTMRQFLLHMKDMKMISKELTPKAIVDILASDDPKVRDQQGAVNLELEMGFLDFLEALVGCAEVFVTEAVLRDPSFSNLTVNGQRRGSLGMEERDDKSLESGISLAKELTTSSAAVIEALISKVHADTPIYDSHPREAVEKIKTELIADESVVNLTETLNKVDEMENLVAHYSFLENQNPGDSDRDYGVSPFMLITEETRQFNFWTHQIHIFFIQKFLPACHHLLNVKGRVHRAMDKSKNALCMTSSQANIAGC